MIQKILMGIGIVAILGVMGWCSHVTGTGRASVSDVRAIQTQVAERCR
jgi:hypothetical protein